MNIHTEEANAVLVVSKDNESTTLAKRKLGFIVQNAYEHKRETVAVIV